MPPVRRQTFRSNGYPSVATGDGTIETHMSPYNLGAQTIASGQLVNTLSRCVSKMDTWFIPAVTSVVTIFGMSVAVASMMKKSDKPSRVVDKSNLLVKYVGIKDIPQNSEMFSKLSKSVTYEEEDVVVNSNIENLTLYRIPFGVYFLMRGSDCIAKCAIVNSKSRTFWWI
jgi:hypothetical protein